MISSAREEGFEKGKIDIARSLMDILDMETISDKTGLTLEQVKKLKN